MRHHVPTVPTMQMQLPDDGLRNGFTEREPDPDPDHFLTIVNGMMECLESVVPKREH